MYASLLLTVATFAGGEAPPPPPPAPVEIVAPVQATPEVPIHDGRPQAPEGQTALDATIIPDDGWGFPVETGPAEIRSLKRPYDVADLAELCVPKPWLCS